jgi:hypothetical protein
MALKKGEVLNPSGRPKGAANKTTSEIRAAFQLLVSNNIDTLQADIDKLEPEKRIAYIIKFAEFLLPKLQSLSIENQLDMEYKQLEMLLNSATPEAIEAITAKILTLKIQNNESDN